MTTGQVELDYPNLGPQLMIDFEGPIVSYNTPCRVETELVSASQGRVAYSSTDVVSTVKQ